MQNYQTKDTRPYENLTPDTVLAALEALGFEINGQFLALNSYENRVYQIGREEAAPVVVKFYRPNRWSDNAILEEHEFCYQLAEYDIPVALPLQINQKTLHEYEGYRIAVYERKSGHAPEVDQLSELKQLGRLLGRIHAVGTTQKFQHRVRLTSQRLGHEARQQVLASGFLPDYLQESYAHVTESLLTIIDNQMDDYLLPVYRRIHGDFHMGNVLANQGVIWIVDLDDCCSGPAIQDIWMLLSGEKHEKEAQIAAIISGYQEFFDFDPSELSLIESLRTLRMMNYSAWLANRWGDPAFPQSFPWFDSPRYWEEHLNALQEQLYLLQGNDERLSLKL